MLSKLLCAKRRKSHNSTKYCESIIKSAGIKQMAIQHHRYDQHLSQFWKHLVTYFRTGRPIQTNNSNCMGGGRTTRVIDDERQSDICCQRTGRLGIFSFLLVTFPRCEACQKFLVLAGFDCTGWGEMFG